MIEKKIDCFPTDQSKMIDYRFLIGITTLMSYYKNLDELVTRYEKCLERYGDYVDK